MKKRLIGYVLLLVLITQVFPVDGMRFWTMLIQGKAQTSAAALVTLEEEEVEEIQFKLKTIESNHPLYFETRASILTNQAVHSIITKMGETIDRNDPILIPPPNPSV